jgi:hypothetical protein
MAKIRYALMLASLLALQSTHALALDKTTGHPIVTITGLISEKTAVRMRNLMQPCWTSCHR